MCSSSSKLLQAATCLLQANSGILWRIAAFFAAHLRRNSAIAADFEGKNSCSGAFFSRHRRHKSQTTENACCL